MPINKSGGGDHPYPASPSDANLRFSGNFEEYHFPKPCASVFDRANRKCLQDAIIAGYIDPDELLQDVLDYIEDNYCNLFCNFDTREHVRVIYNPNTASKGADNRGNIT